MTRGRYVALALFCSPLLAYAAIWVSDLLGLNPAARSGEGLVAIALVPIFVFVVGLGAMTRRTPGEVAAVVGASIVTTIGGGFLLLLILPSRADLN